MTIYYYLNDGETQLTYDDVLTMDRQTLQQHMKKLNKSANQKTETMRNILLESLTNSKHFGTYEPEVFQIQRQHDELDYAPHDELNDVQHDEINYAPQQLRPGCGYRTNREFLNSRQGTSNGTRRSRRPRLRHSFVDNTNNTIDDDNDDNIVNNGRRFLWNWRTPLTLGITALVANAIKNAPERQFVPKPAVYKESTDPDKRFNYLDPITNPYFEQYDNYDLMHYTPKQKDAIENMLNMDCFQNRHDEDGVCYRPKNYAEGQKTIDDFMLKMHHDGGRGKSSKHGRSNRRSIHRMKHKKRANRTKTRKKYLRKTHAT